MTTTTTPDDIAGRRHTARVLANARFADLHARWRDWAEALDVDYVRGPEAGLVMVQGRVGGTGDRFNLGEATVTRATASVRLAGDESTRSTGTAYVLGSHPEHAGIAAVFDALLQGPARDRVLDEVIAPLAALQDARDTAARADARATVVDFFTVARENDGVESDRADDEDDE